MHHALILGLLLTGVRAEAQASGATYPRGELLVEPAELAKPEVARTFLILDVRDRKSYEQGHIPSAIWLDAREWAKTFGDGKDPEGWSRKLGQLGIRADSRILVYDDNFAKDAARIWWILRYWGVADARLLNGGWTGWKSGSFPVQKDTPRSLTAVVFEARAARPRLAIRQQVLDDLDKSEAQIVDARSPAEHLGKEKMNNKRVGAIPGSRNLEWSDLLDRNTRRFKNPDELRRLFRSAGIDLDKRLTCHCQSGGRSSVMVFALELMGTRDVRNYHAGWADWGNTEDTPVILPKSEAKK
jgi:thiosulfate/3-mercaptopyruvate sulfurtransferase